MSERVFVDSSAYFAANDPRDDNHAAAAATLRRLVQQRAEMYTTNYVVAETHTLLLTRRNRDVAAEVLARLDASDTRIIRATEGDETRARQIIHQFHDKDYSLIDAISFAVMERLHLRLAWTYDHHFAQFGFAPIS
jgi:predicted nucleic acid-binding protein